MFIVFLLFVDGKKERWKSYLLGKVRLMIFFLLLLFVAVEFLFQDFSSQCIVHCTA